MQELHRGRSGRRGLCHRWLSKRENSAILGHVWMCHRPERLVDDSIRRFSAAYRMIIVGVFAMRRRHILEEYPQIVASCQENFQCCQVCPVKYLWIRRLHHLLVALDIPRRSHSSLSDMRRVGSVAVVCVGESCADVSDGGAAPEGAVRRGDGVVRQSADRACRALAALPLPSVVSRM